ncbi:hypothetical protein TD95_004311 [Thielaviopsis punctulata]|uniref:Trafficking protein particle complex subunit 12 n=1 Tax=Thielaviopsis punctulata TaxID=72032 RepID=A0A0F4Z9I4_9PEZI|nr:hypothetical protein TD95_004311 [Thielaviopsis punctulata]
MATLPMMEPSLLSPRSPIRSPRISESGRPRDFSFILRPDIYHSLNAVAIPAPFKNSSKQPRPDLSVAELFSTGHFRAAATAAAAELTSGTLDATNHRRIFDLLYTRLASLLLIDAAPIAAQEVKALEDLATGPVYVDEATGDHVVPWDLRVLAVKLQALGFGDLRRAVMSYYDLAREARANVAMARNDQDKHLWALRLRELGVRVAWTLVDLDDMPAAIAHLQTLPATAGDARATLAEALLWLHLGDAEAARASVSSLQGDGGERSEGGMVQALADMADGDFESALTKFTALAALNPDDKPSEIVQVNRAVCLLYTGHMDEASQVLEYLVDHGFASRTLLLNLSTIYELCTDKNRGLKTSLAARVAAREPSEEGWEYANVDFKL